MALELEKDETMVQIQIGHWLMALCAALYLVWWIIFFRPGAGKVQGALFWFGAGCLVVAAVAGIIGAVSIAMGANSFAADSWLSGWWFVLGAVIAYVLLAWITKHFWNRPITTELILFVAWAALELYVACSLASAGAITTIALGWFIGIVIALFAISLVCYVLYYQLAALPSFIDGAIPLAAIGIFSVVLPLLLRSISL